MFVHSETSDHLKQIEFVNQTKTLLSTHYYYYYSNYADHWSAGNGRFIGHEVGYFRFHARAVSFSVIRREHFWCEKLIIG